MRGENLEGLSVEELHQMERKLEAGLHRVLSTKVGRLLKVFSILQLLCLGLCITVFDIMHVSSGPAIHATNQRITAKGEK